MNNEAARKCAYSEYNEKWEGESAEKTRNLYNSAISKNQIQGAIAMQDVALTLLGFPRSKRTTVLDAPSWNWIEWMLKK